MTTLNIKQLGYNVASSSDSLRSNARLLLDSYPNAHEEISDEVKTELYSGFQLRFAENNPDINQHYVVKDNQYIVATEKDFKDFKGEKLQLSIGYITNMTAQEFGTLKTKQPAKYTLLKPLRDKVNKYCSNRLNDLKRAMKSIKNEGVVRERGATKSFLETWTDTLDSLKKKCKNAQARGDDTANDKKLNLAITAFKNAMK